MAESEAQAEARDEVQDEVMEDAADEEGASSEDEGSAESEAEPVLAVTRERRKNAGNRMSKLLALAEEEDAQQEEDYGEIFAESADDVDFQAKDGDEDDVNMDSSSEDEDAEAAQDEDAGEKEVRRQERSENPTKRKKKTLLEESLKRAAAKVGPRPTTNGSNAGSSSAGQAMCARKKSERVSWTQASAAVRASKRGLAQQNRMEVQQRLEEKEQHRLRTVANMEAAEKRREANRPKILTQEERLAEAARVERLNSKSLNRWETTEKKRMEEQKARLDALKNHRLEGPIIAYYSGPALFVNDRLKAVGKQALIEELPNTQPATTDAPDKDTEVSSSSGAAQSVEAGSRRASMDLPLRPSSSPSVGTWPSPQPSVGQPETSTSGFLSGIEALANSAPEPRPSTPSNASLQGSTFTATSQSTPPFSQPTSQPHSLYQTPNGPNSAPPTSESLLAQFQNPVAQFQSTFSIHNRPLPLQPTQPKPPPRKEIAARVLITLRDFPDQENLSQSKKEPDFIRNALLDWPYTPQTKKQNHAAPAKKVQTCAVTGQPARYCDPGTGLYYADAAALKSMRYVVTSKAKWSELTGTFAHPTDLAANNRPARGVPNWFLLEGDTLAKRKAEVTVVREARLKAEREQRERLEADLRERERMRVEAQERMRAQMQAQGQANPQPMPTQGLVQGQTAQPIQVSVQIPARPTPAPLANAQKGPGQPAPNAPQVSSGQAAPIMQQAVPGQSATE